jgi:hypothetical protein
MSDQPPITTPAQLAAEVRDAILKHVPDDRFAEVFGTLPPAAQARIARQFSPRPVRFKFNITRRL